MQLSICCFFTNQSASWYTYSLCLCLRRSLNRSPLSGSNSNRKNRNPRFVSSDDSFIDICWAVQYMNVWPLMLAYTRKPPQLVLSTSICSIHLSMNVDTSKARFGFNSNKPRVVKQSSGDSTLVNCLLTLTPLNSHRGRGHQTQVAVPWVWRHLNQCSHWERLRSRHYSRRWDCSGSRWVPLWTGDQDIVYSTACYRIDSLRRQSLSAIDVNRRTSLLKRIQSFKSTASSGLTAVELLSASVS